MKRLLVITAIIVAASFTGCVGWAHWGGPGHPPKDQHQEWQDKSHDNSGHQR